MNTPEPNSSQAYGASQPTSPQPDEVDAPSTGKEAWDPSSTENLDERKDYSARLIVSGRFDKFPLVTDITDVHVDYKEIGTYSMLVYHRGRYRGIILVDARVVGSHKCALFDYAKTDTDWLTFTSKFRDLFIPIHVQG